MASSRNVFDLEQESNSTRNPESRRSGKRSSQDPFNFGPPDLPSRPKRGNPPRNAMGGAGQVQKPAVSGVGGETGGAWIFDSTGNMERSSKPPYMDSEGIIHLG